MLLISVQRKLYHITANRPDCQSIFGLAREVAAALGEPLKTPALDYTETEVEKEGFNVTVEAQDLCPRYTAISIPLR